MPGSILQSSPESRTNRVSGYCSRCCWINNQRDLTEVRRCRVTIKDNLNIITFIIRNSDHFYSWIVCRMSSIHQYPSRNSPSIIKSNIGKFQMICTSKVCRTSTKLVVYSIKYKIARRVNRCCCNLLLSCICS